MTDIPKFDENQPYGTVIGHPGVRYNQNGHRFNGRKEYVPDELAASEERVSARAKQEEKDARKEALKEAFKETLATGKAVTIVEPGSVASMIPTIDENGRGDNIDLDDLHWTKLRQMIEDIGGKYINKTQAVEYLRNHRGVIGAEASSDEILPEGED